jgi:phosphonate transport system substrate-binding protein
MLAERDFTPTFSGKHDNSILGVANKDYDAASIANSVKARMIKREVVKDEDLKVLYKSQTFPTTGYGYAYNLTPELQQKIRESFETFEWEGTTLKEEFEKNGEGQFIPITYQEHWDVIRTIDAANEVHPDHLPGALGRDPHDRRGQRRFLRLQVSPEAEAAAPWRGRG